MRKKLIEVAIPLEVINAASAKEKNNPFLRGHPRGLHQWWARRPLAACRAMIFTSLIDAPTHDPANWTDEGVPDEAKVHQRFQELFELIAELVPWENASNETVLTRARAEIAACVASTRVYDWKEWSLKDSVCGESLKAFIERKATPANVNAFLEAYGPPVLDPFCGGGSIPVEATRLGLTAKASDLNPVPVLINKALIELPARFAGMRPVHPHANSQPKGKGHKTKQKTLAAREWRGAAGLAADLRLYGQWVRDEAKKRVGHLYPAMQVTETAAAGRSDLRQYVGESLTVIAWLWARTIKCPNPSCGKRIPLVRSFTLSSKGGKKVFLQPVIEDDSPLRFDVHTEGVPPAGTSDRTGARCLYCTRFIKKPELREVACRDGIETIPLAVVCEGIRGRVYLPADSATMSLPADPVDAEFLAQPMTNDKRWFSPPLYGLPDFADLFTARQKHGLMALSALVQQVRGQIIADASAAGMTTPDLYADAICTFLACAVDKATDYANALCTWNPGNQNIGHLFTKHAIPMAWDFAESNLIEGGLDIGSLADGIAEILDRLPPTMPASSEAAQRDAMDVATYDKRAVVCTDPPYYDNIGYADLADFFYLWLRRTLPEIYPDLFRTIVTPKREELIASAYRHAGDKAAATSFFEEGLGRAFACMRRMANPDFPLTVYYAFKQSEEDEDEDESGESVTAVASTGWESMLEGLVSAGFTITGTWPIRTERTTRSIGIGTNALASSIVLVCRPREANAPITSRKDFVAALKRELPEALRELQQGNIAPVDLAQAAIGPGMAVYSRYSKVLESSGERLRVRTALALINNALDEVLAEQEGDYDADTRWSLKWFEQFAHDSGPFGDANTFATAMNIGINGLVETGIVQAKAGKVRLLKRTELMNGHPETWDPATDTDIVHWEVCQYLIHALDTKGEAGAAALLRRINARYPGASETARELAYRLYTICERKKWAQEAMAYNSLIVAWPEIVKLAQSSDGSGGEAQTTMF